MFHLIGKVYGELTAREQYNVLVLGLDNAGKTTFLERVKHQCNPQYKMTPAERVLPTLGQNVASVTPSPGVVLKFWDVGGQDTLRDMWPEYYASAHAVVFVIDSNDLARMDECRKVLMAVVGDDAVEGAQFLVLANKSDLPHALDLVEIKESVNPLLEHLNARDSRVLKISSLSGEGIEQALEWVSNRVVRNKSSRAPLKC